MSTNNTKQAAWVAIGSFCSFALSVVSSIILSRYFNKADYGTYKQVLYVYNTLLTVFTLGLPKAYSYFLPRVKPEQAKSLINKLTSFFLVLGTVFSLLLFLGSSQIASILKNSDLEVALRWFSIVPLLMLPTMGLEGILSTYRRTFFLAIYTVTTRLLMLLCIALPVMLFDLGYIDAIIGFVISSAITCALALYLQYKPVHHDGNEPSPITSCEILRFALPLLYASLWGIVISSADQFFISRYYGNIVFAEFANGSLELPFVGMIIGACATVLSPIFSRMKHEQVDFREVVYPMWMNVFEKTAKLIYPILAFCGVFAQPIMVALYGEQYAGSGLYFQLKMVTNIFNLIVFAPLLINTGKVQYYSNVHALTAFVLVASEYGCVKVFHTPYAIAVVSMLCQIGKTFLLLHVVAKMFRVSLLNLFPWRVILEILIPSITLLYGLSCVLSLFAFSPLASIAIAFPIYILLFILYTYYRNIDYISIIRPLMKSEN